MILSLGPQLLSKMRFKNLNKSVVGSSLLKLRKNAENHCNHWSASQLLESCFVAIQEIPFVAEICQYVGLGY